MLLSIATSNDVNDFPRSTVKQASARRPHSLGIIASHPSMSLSRTLAMKNIMIWTLRLQSASRALQDC